jgi:hypothetical protein
MSVIKLKCKVTLHLLLLLVKREPGQANPALSILGDIVPKVIVRRSNWTK